MIRPTTESGIHRMLTLRMTGSVAHGLTVHFADNDVNAADYGRHIGDQATPAKLVAHAEIAKRGRPSPYPQWHRILGRPAYYIKAHLAARTLCFLVRLTRGEMAGLLNAVRALGRGIAAQPLLDDLDAFHHFDHTHVITMPGVAD